MRIKMRIMSASPGVFTLRGCRVFAALKKLFDEFKVSYTFLSKEFCCGWIPLGQKAVMAKKRRRHHALQKICERIHPALKPMVERRYLFLPMPERDLVETGIPTAPP